MTPTSESCLTNETETLHATFLGFFGDWEAAPIMEQHDYREVMDLVNTSNLSDYQDHVDWDINTDISLAFLCDSEGNPVNQADRHQDEQGIIKFPPGQVGDNRRRQRNPDHDFAQQGKVFPFEKAHPAQDRAQQDNGRKTPGPGKNVNHR